MKHILNKDVDRQQRLLMFMFKDDTWKSAKSISDVLECNIKTLRQDMDYLTTTYDDIISCEYSKNRGYKFWVKQGHSVQEIFLDWINHSLFFSIITDVLYEKNKEDKDYFYNTYFISETTLKRQVALINYHLKELGISLSLTKMTFRVQDEFIARLFFGNREMEKRSIYDWDDRQIDNQRYAFSVIEMMEKDYSLSLTMLQKNMIAYFVLCSVIRSSNNHFMTEKISSQIIKKTSYYPVLYSFINPQENAPYLITDEQVEDTILFLSYLFSKLKYAYESVETHQISDLLIQQIEEKMKTDDAVFDRESLAKDIAYTLFLKDNYPYKMSYINHRGYFNAMAIQLKYPIFYDAVMTSFSKLPNEFIWINHYSLELINSIFRYWHASEYDYITKVNQVKVYISTTLNENQAKLNQYIFEKTFQQKVKVIGYEYNRTSFNTQHTELIDDADVIVANHLFYSTLDNVIVVNDVIDDAKLYYINNRLDTIRKSQIKV